eukprot:12398052-Ditylum_brightwellii.AAC.1
MSKYFGRHLRLRKAIYGLTLSGKLWVTEFLEWLLNQGFIQSKAETAYFILYKDEKTWLRPIFYIYDMLYFGSNGQMRIHQHNDGSYSLDQTRYTSNIIHKYNPKTCSWGLPQHRTIQAPPDYVYSKENRPSSKEEREWNLGMHFYSNVFKSPANQVADKHKIGSSDILIFTDASWQDCPDICRSTTGYYIFYQGSVIEGNSQVNVPIAMSSAESEYMAACPAYMAAAH